MARASASGVSAGSFTFCASASSRMVASRSEPSRWQWRSVLGRAWRSSSETAGWVSPGNPYNTVGRAVVVSLFLAIASYLTLARFLWFLFFPWLLYALIWLTTVVGAYGVSFFSALLLSIALTLLSFLVSLIFGVQR